MLSRKYFDRSGPPVLRSVRRCVRRCVGLGVASWAVVAALALPTYAQEPSSATFVLSQSTTSSGGGSSVSPSFLLDGSLSQIGSSSLPSFFSNHTWVEQSGTAAIPTGTRHIEYHFLGDRDAGSNNDAFLDNAYLTVPDGGSSFALFGLALAGLGVSRRR